MLISLDEVRQLGVEHAAELHVRRYWQELFLLKSRDWEQEHEFRWVVRGNEEDDFYVGIENALVGIALGDRFPDRYRAAVADFGKSASVSLAIINWQNGMPQPYPADGPWIASAVQKPPSR